MTPVVRAAAAGDTVALHALILAHAAFEESAASLTVDELGMIIAAGGPPINLLVAGDSEALLGYAAVTFDWSLWRAHRYSHLDCLFVTESARGGGVGRALFAAALHLASSRGADRLEWQTPDWNAGAMRFYRLAGARCERKVRFAKEL